MSDLRLGVNVDHVATIRQARLTDYPDPVEAALAAEKGGAQGITVHLREDRRHIQDADVRRLKDVLSTKLNLEMAADAAIVELAREIMPQDVCVVPEKREELTTEGGLAVAGNESSLAEILEPLRAGGVTISLFIDPEPAELDAAAAIGVPVVELHTGAYAEVKTEEERRRELERIRAAAVHARARGLQVNAGHGLTLDNVGEIAAMPEMVELNIGHSIVARAIMVGMEQATREMAEAMTDARR